MNDDPFPPEDRATAAGILQCLKMMAEEADKQHLPRTHLALCKAIRACQAESNNRLIPTRPRTRRHIVLH